MGREQNEQKARSEIYAGYERKRDAGHSAG